MTSLFCQVECSPELREFLVVFDRSIWLSVLYLPMLSLPAFGVALIFPKTRPVVRSIAVAVLGIFVIIWALLTSEEPLKYTWGSVSPTALLILSFYVVLILGVMAWLAIWKKSRKVFGNLALAIWVLMGLLIIAVTAHIGNPNN